jgi:NAD(P)-dependent dehydrogenase (short-subunit alcohol dehydrogenase family)
LESFGIKVILVEPGVIKTNIVNDMVIAKKSQNPITIFPDNAKNVY